MREYYKKKRLYRILRSPITLIALTVVFITLIISTGKIYLRARKAIVLRDNIRAELHGLESRKDALQDEIEYLETDLGKEDEIRTKFNVRKPGEKVLVIVDESTTTAEVQEKRGLFSRIWRALTP